MNSLDTVVGKWEWNLLTKKYSWCEDMHRIFQVPPQPVNLRTGSFFNRVHPEDKDMVVRAFGQALIGKQPYRLEHRIVWPDGSVRLVKGEAEVIFDQGGRPLCMRGTVKDITTLPQSYEAEDRV